MIIFKADETQIKQLVGNVVNASIPVGMGFIHFDPALINVDQLRLDWEKDIHLDYVQGRMVKLNLKYLQDDFWQHTGFLDSEYQSWMAKYPTIPKLLDTLDIDYDVKEDE